jgi:hypothetical protein
MMKCFVLFEVWAEFLSTVCMSFGLPILNLSKLSPIAVADKLLTFKIICKIIRNLKFHCLFEATSYYHNVFTFTLFLPEGRAGVAWEPSKIMLFPPPLETSALRVNY